MYKIDQLKQVHMGQFLIPQLEYDTNGAKIVINLTLTYSFSMINIQVG